MKEARGWMRTRLLTRHGDGSHYACGNGEEADDDDGDDVDG